MPLSPLSENSSSDTDIDNSERLIASLKISLTRRDQTLIRMPELALAEVKVSKLKDCPTLTAGRLTPTVHQEWTIACHRYLKHAQIKPDEIVSFVADAMLDPRLVSWYHGDQTRIDKLTLPKYLEELAELMLDRNWAHLLKMEILSSRQGNQEFIFWKIGVETKNAILKNTAPAYAMTPEALKLQLEANLNDDLKLDLNTEPVLTTEFQAWSREVKERDDRLRFTRDRMQREIAANNAIRSARRSDKRDLASRLSKPSTSSGSISQQLVSAIRHRLPKLTDAEKKLLDEHEGCNRCRKFYAGHRSNNCPLKTSDTWPSGENYTTLTLAMARAAPHVPAGFVTSTSKVEEYMDDDTDSYVSPPIDLPPFTIPHLFAPLDVTGPLITSFPLSIHAMLDIGCPSTVISESLVASLGLRRFPLPPKEDNLSSLSEKPLHCTEFVKLEVVSGKGDRKRHV